MSLAAAIREFITGRSEPVHLRDLYAELPGYRQHSIRARVYESMGKLFRRVGKGLYVAVKGDATCVVANGDAWEEVKKLPTQAVDALITDPPYGWLDHFVQLGTTNRRMEWKFERRDIDRELGLELYRVLKEGAYAFVFVPSETGTTRPHINRLIDTLEACGFVFRKRFIWDKLVNGMGYAGRARHEGILFFTRGLLKVPPRDRGVPDVLAYKAIPPKRRLHPCEKPEGLLREIIRFATRVGDVILDIFAGSLATGRAALGLGRAAVCIEKDSEVLARALEFAPEIST